MQEAVGNQETQQSMASEASGRGYGAYGSPELVDAYDAYNTPELASAPSLPSNPDAYGAPNSADGYGVYNTPPLAVAPSLPALPDNYSSYGSPEATAEHIASSVPASPDNYSSYGSHGSAVAPIAPASSGPASSTTEDFAMKPMLPGMTNFDSSVQRPNPHMQTSLPSTTYYADTAEKRAPYARGFDEQGKMSNLSDGGSLNTIGAERPAAHGAKGDRHIFTMDGQGQFYSGDAIRENRERGQVAADNGASQQERFHHSSFLGGEDVAGAGEMQVRDGQVELVSDTSGHYQPGSKQMMQTVQQLQKNNVQTERLGVEFVGKNGTNNMQASATELLGYADHSPETAETQMRAMHGKKNSVLGELLSKTRNTPDGHNAIPSELGRRPEEAASSNVAPDQVPDHSYAYNNDEDYVKYEEIEEEQEEIGYNNLDEIEDEDDDYYYNEDEMDEEEDEDSIKYIS